MTTLGKLLVDPGIIEAAVDADGERLEHVGAGMAANHPLRGAIARAREGKARLRLVPLTSRVSLLDLGHQAGEPGLILCVPPSTPDVDRTLCVWVAWGFERPTVNLFLGPALTRLTTDLSDKGNYQKLHDIISSKAFQDTTIETRVRVEHALTPLSYRIYPDTPITEVQHLMVRRGLAVVPVVGQDLEVLGVITATDVLPHLLPGGEGTDPATQDVPLARDVMTRSVLCVSEEEELLEASRSMMARGVAQLPVVREGELIGFLDRTTVMRAFAEGGEG